MGKTIAIGTQDFKQLREGNYFYIDKTGFIKEWWEEKDSVTLITRPRRFGKTVTMSMLDYFFSNRYKDNGKIFEGLKIWNAETYRKLQGTYPVIFLSFAGVKQNTYADARRLINELIVKLFIQYEWLLKDARFTTKDQDFYQQVSGNMSDATAALSLNILSEWLHRYYGQKCILLLDEYDTPMQEAYVHGYWSELTGYIRALFNNTFKTNPSMERAIMTGITRISKESIFSDLNNLTVITTTSNKYADCFGFTEEEVFAAMDEQGIDPAQKSLVKKWYDGFTFGEVTDIYNPWSVLNYLDTGKLDTYWANTSGNGLVGKLLQQGDKQIKMDFETLLRGGTIESALDEQIIFDQLDDDNDAIWSLLFASGYLKLMDLKEDPEGDELPLYRLALTNKEVKRMFTRLIRTWFKKAKVFPEFVAAMLTGDVKVMNAYMNKVALSIFSYFDTGRSPECEPERFYHGFVLGLLVENSSRHTVRSNRESGYGRYDVILEPINKDDVAVIMEFKVFDKDEETDLSDTTDSALRQISEKKYETELLAQGVPEKNILKYGFAFRGKECLIKKG